MVFTKHIATKALRHQKRAFQLITGTMRTAGTPTTLLGASGPCKCACAQSGPSHFIHSSTSLASPKDDNNQITKDVTNGKYLNYSMIYHDSVAFLLSNQLGIPTFMATQDNAGKIPSQVASEFNLSIRAASALLVTLCRMDVVQVLQDSDDSVDDIVYELTTSAKAFLADRSATSSFSPFADTLCTNFITPKALLECSRPEEKKDLMSEMLEQDDDEVANNARHFMAHMNAQSYCCAESLPKALGLSNVDKPTTFLDVGGGSAIYSISAVRSNPNVKGIVFELPPIKPITMEYIDDAGLSDRISVKAGNFFTDSFPGPVDYVLFSNILHDWPDEINMALIEKAYNCLAPGGKVVISEILLSDDVRSSASSATSMNVIMLPYTKGRQYRPKELFRRLERVGFVDPHVTNLVDDYDLVIATKK